ncbi:MAG: hypothetical protein JST32_03005 [Bacteroidetes bacterium]|nr:hypothetical protein [Bacteroidota bacterium]
MSFCGYAQAVKIEDYKVKTAANAKDRTAILDALRADLYKEWKLTFEFYVDHLGVGNNYAWFTGSADRKDGKELVMPDDSYDCCHVEALLMKKNGKWVVLAGGAFSTDVWYEAIAKKYPAAPKAIFGKDSPALMDH